MKLYRIIALLLLTVIPSLSQGTHIMDIFPRPSVVVGELRFWDLDVSAYEGFKADPTITSSIVYELWGALPGVTENLCMDTSGKLLFCGPGGGGAEWADNAGVDPFLQPVDGVTKAVSIGVITELAKLGIVGDDTAQITAIIREVAAQTADIFQVQQSSGTASFVVEADGEVGIGTANPSNILHIVYPNGQFFFNAPFHQMRIDRDTADNQAPFFVFGKSRAGGPLSAFDQIGGINYIGINSASAEVTLSTDLVLITNATAGSEAATRAFSVMEAGVLTQKITIRPNDIRFLDNLILNLDSAHSVFSSAVRPTSIWGDLINAEEFQLENAAHTGHFVFKFQDANTELQILDTAGAEMMTFQAALDIILIFEDLVPSGTVEFGASGSRVSKLWVGGIDAAGNIDPDSDATRNMGFSTVQWNIVDTRVLNVGNSVTNTGTIVFECPTCIGSTMTTVDGGIKYNGDFIPLATDLFDFGTDPLRWRKLFVASIDVFGGDVDIQQDPNINLFVDLIAGDDINDLIFLRFLNSSKTNGFSINWDHTNDSLNINDLTNDTARFSADQVQIETIIPMGSTDTLGTPGDPWDDVQFAGEIKGGGTVGMNWLPDTDSSRNLGSGTLGWKTAFITGLELEDASDNKIVELNNTTASATQIRLIDPGGTRRMNIGFFGAGDNDATVSLLGPLTADNVAMTTADAAGTPALQIGNISVVKSQCSALPADATDLASALTLINAQKDCINENNHGLAAGT